MLNADEFWFFMIYFIIPTGVMEAGYKLIENFIYQPPTWLDVSVAAVIPVAALPVAFFALWAFTGIAALCVDIPYYTEWLRSRFSRATQKA